MHIFRADAAPAAAAPRATVSDPTGWLLAPIVIIAALLRFHLAARSPLWFEEIYVMLVARNPAARVLWIAHHDIHPPVPFLLRHALDAAGGGTALAQKSLSIACFLLALPVAWSLTRRLFGGRAPALATGLMAVSYPLVRYGQEVNMFSLQWLLALAVVDAWTRWLESGRRRDAAAGLAILVAALYTHYVFLAIEAVVFAWGLVVQRRDPRRLATWVGLQALAALAFAPQVPVLAEQLAREGTLRFSVFPSTADFAAYSSLLGLHHRAFEWILGGTALVPFLDRRQRAGAVLLGMLVLLTPFARRILPVTFPTEFLFAAPFAYALVAAGVDRPPLRGVRVALAAALAVYAAVGSWRLPPFHEPVAQMQALRTLQARRAAGDLVVHAEAHSLLFGLFYDPQGRNRLLLEDSGTQYFDGGLAIPDSVRMPPAGFAAARAGGRAWWGLAVDRARVSRNLITRAGAAQVATIDSLARGPRWVTPPVTLWQGRAGSVR